MPVLVPACLEAHAACCVSILTLSAYLSREPEQRGMSAKGPCIVWFYLGRSLA